MAEVQCRWPGLLRDREALTANDIEEASPHAPEDAVNAERDHAHHHPVQHDTSERMDGSLSFEHDGMAPTTGEYEEHIHRLDVGPNEGDDMPNSGPIDSDGQRARPLQSRAAIVVKLRGTECPFVCAPCSTLASGSQRRDNGEHGESFHGRARRIGRAAHAPEPGIYGSGDLSNQGGCSISNEPTATASECNLVTPLRATTRGLGIVEAEGLHAGRRRGRHGGELLSGRAASVPRQRSRRDEEGRLPDRCWKEPCRQAKQELARLRAEKERWENGGQERFLRSHLRSITAQCMEEIYKAQQKLEVLASTCRHAAWCRYEDRLWRVTEERDELRVQVSDLKARLGDAETRANTAESRELQEQSAYIEKAKEVAKVKKQKLDVRAQLRRVVDELKTSRAERDAAVSEAGNAVESERALSEALQRRDEELEAAKESTDRALSALREATRVGPKEYSNEEYEGLNSNALRQARFKERQFFRWLVAGRNWRVQNIVQVMKELGWIDILFETRAFQDLFTEKLRDLTRTLEKVHFGTNFGLWLHLQKKLPSRTVREIRQAASEKYDTNLDRYKRKVWYKNPFNSADVVYVPFVAPAPTSYSSDVEEYSLSHGLQSSPDGVSCMQSIGKLVPHVITRDAHRQPSLDIIGNSFEIVLQGDAARRGIKSFSQWVFKNPYLDSQSCGVLHLVGLGVGLKDDKEGTMKMWAEQAKEIRDIQDKFWRVDVNSKTVLVRTELCATVDFHAEKELWGIIGGGCHCQGDDLHHGVPRHRRGTMTCIGKVMEWVKRCKEPTVEEQYTLAHEPIPGEHLPRACSLCGKFRGDQASVVDQYEKEEADFKLLKYAAPLSTKGRDTFNARCLDHAHAHLNVRWKSRGLPLADIPKSRVYLELLHSLALNAAKLQVKHAVMKYYPDAVRDEAHALFKSWGVPIDMRPPGQRTDPDKWPGGGVVLYLIEGGNGKAPGFARVGAQLTFMMAEHELQTKKAREADAACAASAAQAAVQKGESSAQATIAAARSINANMFAKPTSKKRGATSLPLRTTSRPTPDEEESQKKPLPDVECIALESQQHLCTPEQIVKIKARYGPHLGQRVLSTLLSFETFLIAWKTSKKRLPVPATQEQRDALAFEWFHDWADWVEAIERVSNHGFKSWVPHRILYKGTRMIHERGDLWARSTSALEANQSEVGRTLDKVSSKRRSVDTGSQTTARPYLNKTQINQDEEILALDTSMAVSVSQMKVTSAMARTAAKHFIAAQARVHVCPQVDNAFKDCVSVGCRHSKRMKTIQSK